jgi:hypothetical protein
VTAGTTLVFTVAHNGFAYAYRSCLASQREYAERFGYRYVAVTRPWRHSDAALSAWLKVPLTLNALRSGYGRVLFVDADCRITRRAPPLDGLAELEPAVLMALGRSGRLNSGVMFARGDGSGIAFFERVLESVTESIGEEDRARLKYENGNIIRCARTVGGVGELDARWNNTEHPELDDFVRHYTGPMRAQHTPPPGAELLRRLRSRLLGSPTAGPQPAARSSAFEQSLQRLAIEVSRRYPALTSGSES